MPCVPPSPFLRAAQPILLRLPKTLRQPMATGPAPALQQRLQQHGLSPRVRRRRQSLPPRTPGNLHPGMAPACPGVTASLLPWCLPGSGAEGKAVLQLHDCSLNLVLL